MAGNNTIITKELNITISGVAGSGKSRISYLIKEMLKSKGFAVEFDGGIDFMDESDFDACMVEDLDEAIESLSEVVVVKMNEVNFK